MNRVICMQQLKNQCMSVFGVSLLLLNGILDITCFMQSYYSLHDKLSILLISLKHVG